VVNYLGESSLLLVVESGKLLIVGLGQDVWPCALYRESQDDSNSLRNILRKPTAANPNPDRLTYFENMSRAYAEICDDTAVVMHNTTVGGQPVTEIQELTSGIWTTVELPTLKQTGNVGQTNVVCSHSHRIPLLESSKS
jgi:hypothetical protein